MIDSHDLHVCVLSKCWYDILCILLEYDEDDDKDLFDVMGRPTYNEDPQPPINPSSRILAVIYASSIMKRTSEDTFKKHFRSMTTPDVIHQIGRSYFDYLNEVIKRLNEKPWR